MFSFIPLQQFRDRFRGQMRVSVLIDHHVWPFITVPQAASWQQRKAAIKCRLPWFDVQLFSSAA